MRCLSGKSQTEKFRFEINDTEPLVLTHPDYPARNGSATRLSEFVGQ